MKLHRLRVQNFAAIRELEVAFGPGLNVLYGPNDLGKSTLAEAIRLALLLPYTSTHCEPYISWSGGDDPFVDLTFETEEQRIWRVKKQFGKRGSAILQESRNGQDFDDVERARRVDARLREILRWGIPEPGGTGAGKGIPSSFLATALLSTQANVTDVLGGNLHDDPTATGREQIAAALQAVAQDPLFAALLRETQSRRDEAYTDKGAKKTAKGSVFKIAADRVRETREEKERLEKIVEDSEGVERRLRELFEERARSEQRHVEVAERASAVELLARQAADRTAAEEPVRIAQEAVQRIQAMDRDLAEVETRAGELAAVKEQAERNLIDRRSIEVEAAEGLAAAEETARSAGLDSGMADTVARQALELRRVAAEQALQVARQRVEDAGRAQEHVEAADRAAEEHRRQEEEAARSRQKLIESTAAEQAANEALRRCDLLERALEVRAAEKQVASARAAIDKEAVLQAEHAKVSAERSSLVERRKSIVVPPAGILTALRKLAHELASARGALDVGLVMTVIPTAIVNLRVRKDGAVADPGVIAKPFEIEADAEVEVDIADLATVRVRGGRREAQERVRALESRWQAEALPHLAAAGIGSPHDTTALEAFDAKLAEARDLDAEIQSLAGHLESLARQIASLADAAESLRQASAWSETCREELGDVPLDALAPDLDALGPDPVMALRSRRQKASQDAGAARKAAQEAATAQTLAEERARSLLARLEIAKASRDTALAEFPSGVTAGAEAAREVLREVREEQESITAELASLQERIDAKKAELESTLAGARSSAEAASRAVESAQENLSKASTDHAAEAGRLATLKKLRDAQDLGAAERTLREATERLEALPVPERPAGREEVAATREAVTQAKRSLENVDREIHIAQGRLQQVGGAVARERLRDALEAFEQAESHDREIEADYQAWQLLLDLMKEADAAQASNLGQALTPAIATRFQALTRQRYQSIRLTSHLGTEGVVVAGAVRSPERLSVGTREQLSTLYRLCLGEYLQTAIVLDDQLVQSDDTRMDWFRTLLTEKARGLQIIVFTCRPGDYLAPAAMVVEDGTGFKDSDEGFVRAIDLGRSR